MGASEIITLLVSTITAIGMGLLAVWSSRQDQARNRLHERLDAAEACNGRQDNRLTSIEGELKHVPDVNSISQLYEKLNDLSKIVSEINGSQKTLLSILQRDPIKRSRTTDK